MASNNRCVCYMLKKDGEECEREDDLRFRPSCCRFTRHRYWYRANQCVLCAGQEVNRPWFLVDEEIDTIDFIFLFSIRNELDRNQCIFFYPFPLSSPLLPSRHPFAPWPFRLTGSLPSWLWQRGRQSNSKRDPSRVWQGRFSTTSCWPRTGKKKTNLEYLISFNNQTRTKK